MTFQSNVATFIKKNAGTTSENCSNIQHSIATKNKAEGDNLCCDIVLKQQQKSS